MFARCLFSLNKRSKLDRDKKQEFYAEGKHSELHKIASHQKKMYRMKDTFLDFANKNGINPVEVQSINGEDYLLYDIAGKTFHTKIETDKELEMALELPHRSIGSKTMRAEPVFKLEPYSHVQAMMNIINCGNYKTNFKEKEIDKIHYNDFDHINFNYEDRLKLVKFENNDFLKAED